MSTIVLQAEARLIKEMEDYYRDAFSSSFPPYSVFSAKKQGTTITAYRSGKVVFQGIQAQSEAAQWRERGAFEQTKKTGQGKEPVSTLPKGFENWSVLGSDEVGTGSYFGPLTVAAVYVESSKIPLLKELGVKDSKHLSDQQIISTARDLIQFLPYSLLTVWPEKYNVLQPTMSQGKMKALLHNQALLNVMKKIRPEKPQAILIDQFALPDTYFRYLKGEAEVAKENVHFSVKGESRHLAVAAASMIARYAFLEGLKECSKTAGISLPSGAGAKSDVAAARVLKKGGMDLLNKTAKLHFANTEKAKHIAGMK